jgi:hypothetical protein
MWSAPPAEPPAQTTFEVSAFSAASRSFIVLCGEFAGTTTTSWSAVRRAIGVTSASVTCDLLVSTAPTMVMPITIIWLPSPLAWFTNWARPTVPPAPGTLTTCTLFAPPVAVSTCCSERAAPSQPPPAPAGAMIFSSSGAWAAAGSAAAAAMTAAMAPRREMRFTVMFVL